MSKNKISVSSNNSYAQALFELATESNALSEIEKQVNSILVLIKNSEDFSYLIKNPTTRIEDLVKVMEMISEKNNHNELLKRFISFIIKKRAEKTGRNISQNTAVIIPAHNIPAFKPSKTFVKSVKQSVPVS